MPLERQVRLDPLLDDEQPEFLEARDLDLGERLVGEVGERRPAPEVERGAQQLGGPRLLTRLERHATLVHDPREPVDVDAPRIQLARVARGTCGDGRAPERLPQSRHVHLDRVRGGVGRVAGPEVVHEPIDRDDAPRLERQHGEEGTRRGSTERNRPTPRSASSGPRSRISIPKSRSPDVARIPPPASRCCSQASHGTAPVATVALSAL